MNIRKSIGGVLLISLIICFCGCEAKAEVVILPNTTETTAPVEESAPPSPSPEPVQTPIQPPILTPIPTQSNMWGEKFTGKFTDGEVIQKRNIYMSKNVNVTLNTVKEEGLTYYFADIYITDIKYFVSPFSDDGFNTGQRKFVYDIARETSAVVAINGDYCANNSGPVVRDGILYRNEVMCDILVMYKDGTMQTFSNEEYSEESIEAMKDEVWQIWTFGPMLLKDGQPMTQFDFSKNVDSINPRTAIGYFEPGHYAFVTVDGRQPGYSDGLEIQNLSMLMYELGCSVAFNLDGGGTTQMAFMGDEINSPSVHRKTRDAVCIIDEPASYVLY